MSEDIFDIVNERDEVVGQERRSVVHAKGLRHRAVHILIFNTQGDIFLQRRSMSKDVSPGTWDSSCCGHVDAGETYEFAVWRELVEELGLEFSPAEQKEIQMLFKIEACEETGQEFVHVYRLEHEGPFELHPEEIDEGRWFNTTEVDRLVDETPEEFAGSFRYIWRRFRRV